MLMIFFGSSLLIFCVLMLIFFSFHILCMFVDVFSVRLNERKSNQNQVESYFDPCGLCVLNPSPQKDHENSVALYYPLTCLGDPSASLSPEGRSISSTCTGQNSKNHTNFVHVFAVTNPKLLPSWVHCTSSPFTPQKSNLRKKKKNMVAELTNLENYCCWKPNTETGRIATSFLLWSD